MCDSKEIENPENIDTTVKNKKNEDDGSNKIDESRLHYENGKCYYTTPSGERLEWNEEKQKWMENIDSSNSNNDYIWEDGCYYYKDKTTGKKYKWSTESNTWISTNEETVKVTSNIKTVLKENEEEEEDDDDDEEDDEELEDNKKKPAKPVVRQDMSGGIYGTDGENHTYTDPSDGTVYVWDKEKNAWFPKIDEDFLAQYQMSYGFVKPDSATTTIDENKVVAKENEESSKEDITKSSTDENTLKRKLPQEPAWFEVGDEHNTKVYVTNLPTDITEQEFVDLMQKCGLVMKDAETGKMKVKLYTEPGTKNLKGDALCTYIKVESVELALNLLDGYDVKGRKIHVERAKFTMKGNTYDPTLKPRKKRRRDKEKIKKMQEKLFDWRPDKMRGERSKHERIVIIKNLFEPSMFDKDVGLILEYQQDIREECIKCGDIRKVTIYDRHPEGVAQVIFKEAEAADACVQLLNNRWFGQRKITAETWDGKTKYKIIETEEEKQERLKKWSSFLESKSLEKKQSDENENKGEEVESDRAESSLPNSDSDNDTRSSAGSHDETDED